MKRRIFLITFLSGLLLACDDNGVVKFEDSEDSGSITAPTPTPNLFPTSELPIDVNVDVPRSDVIVNLNAENPSKVTLRVNVRDPDFIDEGELYVNGQGPIPLFGALGLGAHDGGILDLDIETDGDFWVNGDNTLSFRHITSAGYRINSITPIPEFNNVPVNPTLPFNISVNNTAVDYKLNLSMPVTANEVLLTMSAFDVDQSNEGELFINGNGPFNLFGSAGIGALDGLNRVIEIPTNAAFWVDGENSVSFRYVMGGGFNVNTIGAYTNLAAPPSPVVMGNVIRIDDVDRSGFETILLKELDYAPIANFVASNWVVEGVTIGRANLTYTFPLGNTNITLSVTDAAGVVTDTVLQVQVVQQ